MAILQDLIDQARGEVEEVVADLYKEKSVKAWANEGMFRLFSKMRTTRQDWLVKRIRSTDSALTIVDETFTPSTLKIISGTTLYTMPPGLVEIRQILPLNDSDRQSGFSFIFRDMVHPDFVDSEYADTSTDLGDRLFYVDLFGVDQLRLTPTPDDSFDIEMYYVEIPKKHLLTETLTFPDWAYTPVVSWIVYKAHKQVNHSDVALMFEIFDKDLNDVIEAMTIRQSQDPQFAPGVWDTSESHHILPARQVAAA